MIKLHLVKPWRLRAVRQRLGNVREQETGLSLMAPVNCPQAGEEAAARGVTDGRSDNRKKAPVSDVIFASKTITNIR
ncbi:MAG: hypothetical protein K0R82_2788 [Flavipsychrobacter sp.]|jgi:hypothetical protein|nr:hypothetical protein [Flavipsychrobacter sp.]